MGSFHCRWGARVFGPTGRHAHTSFIEIWPTLCIQSRNQCSIIIVWQVAESRLNSTNWMWAQPFYRCVSTNRKKSIRLDSQQPSFVGKSKRLKRTNPSHCTSGVVAHRVSFSWQLLGNVLRMFKAEAKLTWPALIAWSFIKCILRSKDSRPLTCQYAWLCQFVNSPGYSIE